ncbi:MAG: hypothetical protein HND48_05655 [Chloroflexi bacterium]|nr:hypothetical protein [Chloroflexota bacterium]
MRSPRPSRRSAEIRSQYRAKVLITTVAQTVRPRPTTVRIADPRSPPNRQEAGGKGKRDHDPGSIEHRALAAHAQPIKLPFAQLSAAVRGEVVQRELKLTHERGICHRKSIVLNAGRPLYNRRGLAEETFA